MFSFVSRYVSMLQRQMSTIYSCRATGAEGGLIPLVLGAKFVFQPYCPYNLRVFTCLQFVWFGSHWKLFFLWEIGVSKCSLNPPGGKTKHGQ